MFVVVVVVALYNCCYIRVFVHVVIMCYVLFFSNWKKTNKKENPQWIERGGEKRL